jgi:hypothetical protein
VCIYHHTSEQNVHAVLVGETLIQREDGWSTYDDPYRLEQSFVHSPDTWNFPDGEIVHEVHDRFAIERKVELSIRFVLDVRIGSCPFGKM